MKELMIETGPASIEATILTLIFLVSGTIMVFMTVVDHIRTGEPNMANYGVAIAAIACSFLFWISF